MGIKSVPSVENQILQGDVAISSRHEDVGEVGGLPDNIIQSSEQSLSRTESQSSRASMVIIAGLASHRLIIRSTDPPGFPAKALLRSLRQAPDQLALPAFFDLQRQLIGGEITFCLCFVLDNHISICQYLLEHHRC